MSEYKLLVACDEGDVVEVRRLLLQVNNPAAAWCWDRKTLLHFSCRHGWLEVTRTLVEQYGCDPESKDGQGITPLYEAYYDYHVDVVRYLVSERGCSTTCRNKVGDTPLHMACREGHLAMVKALTSGQNCEAACKCQNKNGDTPLHVAFRRGHVDIVWYLVSEGECSTAFQNNRDDAPLHKGCDGHVDIVRYLVSEQGCSTVSQNKDGDILLHMACRKGHLAMVKALTSGQNCEAACKCQNNDGDTPLHAACCGGHVDIVRYLVSEHWCSTACKNKWRDTPLHRACREGHVDIVRYLVSEQGCSTACQNNDGDTPLHVACCGGRVDVVRYLVSEHWCSTSCKNKWGNTPLYEACREGHVDIVRYLVSEQGCSTACLNRYGNTPLHVACCRGHVDIVRYLVSEHGDSTACQNNIGDTPLHMACREGAPIAMVKELTSGQNCEAACKCQNNDGDTPLHVACCGGRVDIVRYLVSEHWCSTACLNRYGNTPLHVACCRGHVDIVRYLVSEHGDSTTCQNNIGDTPLHMACREGAPIATVKALTSGQNCETACKCQNKNGDTPLHVAFRRGHVDIVWCLVSERECSTACQSNRDDAPLHKGCDGHVDIVRYLVSEQGCSTVSQNKDGDILLHMACREGHLAMVKALTSGQDGKVACNSQNKRGNTPLHVAFRMGHADIVRYLVSEQRCSTVSQNEDGDILLHMACRKWHLAMVKALTSGQDCKAACKLQNKDGDTPLHAACREGHVDIVRYLVSEQGCNTACRNKVGDTSLHVAFCRGCVDIVWCLVSEGECSTAFQNTRDDTQLREACNGHVDIVRYLVSGQGCSTVSQNKDGDILLHMACRKGHLAMVKALTSGKDCKAACNLQNKNGDTPLHVAFRRGHVDIVWYLVNEGECSTVCQNNRDDAPLHKGCDEHVDIVRYLVSEQGCSTVSQNKDGDILLHMACRKGHLAMVKALTSGQDCKAACNCQNKRGNTPLYVACRMGHVDIVRYLVSEQGCSTTHQNKDGDTPLHVAHRKGHLDIVRYLVSDGGCSTTCQNKDGDTLLHQACRERHLAMVEVLTSRKDCKAACNCQNKRGNTPLHEGCCEGHVDIVRYLISEQRCSTSCKNKDGDTPLHVACREGHLATVEALTSGQDFKAACNCQNIDGDTSLHMACGKGHMDIVRYLVSEQKCSIAHQNRSGNTPLHVACREGHVDIVRFLVSEQGRSTTCQNKSGNTPLHEACRWNRTDVVQFLLSTGRTDPWCKNASNLTPVQLTFNYTISKLFALFAGLTKVKLHTAIRVFIFGNSAAGKSTLVKVIENKVTSRFRALAGQFRNVSGVELKTAGINTVTIQNSRLGTVTIYDLAGQFEYYSSHDALVGNLMSSSVAIFIAVVKLSESEVEVIQTLRYWISFIENCCSRVEAIAHLMVVGSWADKVKEAGEKIDQKWSNIKKACISSSSPLHFVGFTALDCRKLASGGLNNICDMIGSSCTALREFAEQKEILYPHLLHAFISTKLSSEVACRVRELCAHIKAEDDALLPTEPNLLTPLLSSLSDGGHLLYLPNKEDFEAGWVVINKQAVLSEINGTVFAPENFKQHHDIATSTGVVPKSKIAGVFAEKYNIDMILCVLTLFEFCQKIKDSFTFSLIASSDPSRDVSAAITTIDESSESYYFFPALVRVEHPTDVWQSSGPGQYQCGWCLQCSKEGQYLTPRFLHVLLLRLAFSFALAPDSSQQDEASPVLRRRCAIWKNGIQWRDRDDVQTRVEVVEQNQTVFLSVCYPEKRAMACVKLRSSLIAMILKCIKEQCPAVSTSEFLIDPSHLSQHQLSSTKKLTTYSMTDVVKAVQEGKPCALDRTGEKSLDLESALHFEPYHGMQTRLIDKLFDKDFANQEVDDSFLQDLANNIHPKLMQQVPTETVLQMFNISDGCLFYNYCDQFPDERDNPIMRCFRLLLTWKNCDAGGSTYQSLRTTLDKYSIFCGRNPLVNNLVVQVH